MLLRITDWVAVGLVAAAIAGVALDRYKFDPRDPIVGGFQNSTLNSPVPLGDNLIIRTYREKVRGDCPVTSIRSVTDADGRSQPIDSIVWAGGSPTADSIELEYDTGGLPAGQYLLNVTLTYHCPGISFTHVIAPIPFRMGPDPVKELQMEQRSIQGEIENLKVTQ